MVGISRINITDKNTGRGVYRFEKSSKMAGAANKLYRDIFAHLSMPILPGDESKDCTKDSFLAGYDYGMGIDVILRMGGGTELTLQEKFLFTTFNTVTVEYMQNPSTQERGDWFTCRTQLYFVGYDPLDTGQFANWVLLDWLKVKTLTLQKKIVWNPPRQNQKDGARANFIYLPMFSFPSECVLADSRTMYNTTPAARRTPKEKAKWVFRKLLSSS